VGGGQKGGPVSLPEAIVAGAACLILLSISSFSTAVFKLLNCVTLHHYFDVDDGRMLNTGHERVLFYAGNTDCGSWQVSVVVLLLLLVLAPLVSPGIRDRCIYLVFSAMPQTYDECWLVTLCIRYRWACSCCACCLHHGG
jgi:hypothetical protein